MHNIIISFSNRSKSQFSSNRVSSRVSRVLYAPWIANSYWFSYRISPRLVPLIVDSSPQRRRNIHSKSAIRIGWCLNQSYMRLSMNRIQNWWTKIGSWADFDDSNTTNTTSLHYVRRYVGVAHTGKVGPNISLGTPSKMWYWVQFDEPKISNTPLRSIQDLGTRRKFALDSIGCDLRFLRVSGVYERTNVSSRSPFFVAFSQRVPDHPLCVRRELSWSPTWIWTVWAQRAFRSSLHRRSRLETEKRMELVTMGIITTANKRKSGLYSFRSPLHRPHGMLNGGRHHQNYAVI